MRLRAWAAAAVVIPSLLWAAACGSAASDGDGSSSQSSTPTSTSQPTDQPDDDANVAGPEIPADTEVADPVPVDQMPTATGDFGDEPTITMPSTDPPDSLQRRVLLEGDGPVSSAGDWLRVNYVGQVWGGDVFDNSYERGAPIIAQVGAPTRQIVAGWDVGLQGVAAGSRIMLSFPPRDGYGSQGKQPEIAGDDTLVFVIDVVEIIDPAAAGDPDAAPQSVPDGLPTVSGDLGTPPAITVPSSMPEPDDVSVTVLATGDGDPVISGRVLVQYVLTSWDGTHIESSWSAEDLPDVPDDAEVQAGTGMQLVPVSDQSVFGGLSGVPIGSRVLVETPADDSSGAPALAWVMDLVAE